MSIDFEIIDYNQAIYLLCIQVEWLCILCSLNFVLKEIYQINIIEKKSYEAKFLDLIVQRS